MSWRRLAERGWVPCRQAPIHRPRVACGEVGSVGQRHTADIVVIGGGIMGTSLAWQLARRRGTRVLLLEQSGICGGGRRGLLRERSVIAAGASGKTGALLRRHYSNRPETILAQRGWQTFAAWP